MSENEGRRAQRIVELREVFNLQDKTDPRIDLLCERLWKSIDPLGQTFDLRNIDLSGGDFQPSYSSVFRESASGEAWKWSLSNVNLSGANLSEVDLSGANLSGADLSGANLNGAILHGVNLVRTNLCGTNLNLADISSASFEEASMSNASLVNVTVNGNTSFTNIRNPAGCKITRLTLDSLDEFGGLTVGDLAQMTVIDDVARLRQAFGGPWFWSHLCLAICFFLPYVRFVAERLIRAYTAAPGSETISLGRSLWNFIWSGGVTFTKAELHLVSFVCFVFFSLYNVLRLTLLWKTARLETDQFVTKIPSNFSLETERLWEAAYVAVDWLKYLAILVALIHTYHFLSVTMVPIDR